MKPREAFIESIYNNDAAMKSNLHVPKKGGERKAIKYLLMSLVIVACSFNFVLFGVCVGLVGTWRESSCCLYEGSALFLDTLLFDWKVFLAAEGLVKWHLFVMFMGVQ